MRTGFLTLRLECFRLFAGALFAIAHTDLQQVSPRMGDCSWTAL